MPQETRSLKFENIANFQEIALQKALAEGQAVALWRLPNTQNQHLIVDFSETLFWDKPDLENMPAGFLVSPFRNPEGKAYFLHADLHYSSENADLHLGLRTQKVGSFIAKKTNDWLDQIQNHVPNEQPFFPISRKNNTQDTEKQHYTDLVQKGIEAIERGEFLKVVLSRRKKVGLSPNFSLFALFQTLCKTYPHAFVSLTAIPKVGVWIGASPEILVSLDKKGIFRTVALAGTQPKGDLTNLREARWSQKEIEEQALVSRYIINCFKKIRLREFEELGPRTVAAANLLHLRTDFEVDTQTLNFPELASVMLELLHPTSAVCGMPKAPSLEFIQKYEGYDRELYSGFLGQVNIDQEIHLFANLRCMQVFENEAVLYAGAGITQDSAPEKEWTETEQKCQTLLSVLQNL